MCGAFSLYDSLLFALALSFESFMVALANGLHNANFGVKKGILLAILFAACHVAALLIGYALCKTLSDNIGAINDVSGWIAFAVLLFLGIKTVAEGIRCALGKKEKVATSLIGFIVQSAVASLDAFAVGFTIIDYTPLGATVCGGIICGAILLFYSIGFFVGKKFGTRMGKYAAILSGIVYIGLAIEVMLECVV